MIDIDIQFSNSFYKKLDSKNLLDSASKAIEYAGRECNEEIKKEAPVRTGRLRDGHELRGVGLQAVLVNNVEYFPFVVYGTSRQSANNYPQRVIGRLNIHGLVQSRFEESLITRG